MRETVHVVRQLFIWNDTLHQRLKIRSYHKAPLFIVLQFVFDADFADIFEIRGSRRASTGRRLPTELSANAVTLRYEGRDDVARSTTLRFTPAPQALAASSAVYNLQLSPDAECVVHVLAEARQALDDADTLAPQDLRDNYRRLRRQGVDGGKERPRLSSSSELFDGWTNRSVSDLHMLLAETRHGRYPHAGTPWFNTVFGRDGIITAMLSLASSPISRQACYATSPRRRRL